MSEIDPDPRLVQLLSYAIDSAVPKLNCVEHKDWLEWAESWKNGKRVPAYCVDVAHQCFAGDNHSLGQLAWAGKEACYPAYASGWLVVRYIADAMIALGVAFPSGSGVLPLDDRRGQATIGEALGVGAGES